MAEIRLSGVDKIYPGGTHAVHSVDLDIADGEFMIMVGPSGCAKSTILRMIAGLETPSGGTVEIGGRVVNDVAPKDRDIAMVFQSYALYPHMTVRENMAFGLRLRRMPQGEIDTRVGDAARILGLEHLLDRLPKAMSGGQRQRVAMGRAIVREPQAFLMDEPLSNLDAKLRVQMRTEIAKLHQRLKTTTVYVTHDQVEALTLGQRICILRKGVIQQVDTPYQVYQNPANVFVGGFIGSPGMNFMSGQVVVHEGATYVRLGQHHVQLPETVTARMLGGAELNGRDVMVGIRPEHLDVAAEGDPTAMPVHVELVEAMGAEQYAYFTADVAVPDLTELSDTQATSATFVARLDAGASARGGEGMWLRPDVHEIHLFDPTTFTTLLAPADEAEVRARQAGRGSSSGIVQVRETARAQTFSSAPVVATARRERTVAAVEPVVEHGFARPGTGPMAPAAAIEQADPAFAAQSHAHGHELVHEGAYAQRAQAERAALHAQDHGQGQLLAGDPARVASVFDQQPAMPASAIATQPLVAPLAVGEGAAVRPGGFAARPLVAPSAPAATYDTPVQASIPVPMRTPVEPVAVDAEVAGAAELDGAPAQVDVFTPLPAELDAAIDAVDAAVVERPVAPSPFRTALSRMRETQGGGTTSFPVASPGAIQGLRLDLRPSEAPGQGDAEPTSN